MKFAMRDLKDNFRKLTDREQVYLKNGYNSRRAISFVLAHTGRLSGRTLDVGTGKGRFLIRLARRANRVVTIDSNPAEQRFARMNASLHGVAGRIRFVIADAAALPFPDHSFDTVVSMNCLHHLRDLEAVLAEITRVIRPGGRIVLADLDANGFRLFDRMHRREGRPHERFAYRWPQVAALLRRAGCVVRLTRGENTVVLAGRARPQTETS